MPRILLLLIVISFALSQPALCAPRVVVSIKPIHSLVTAVMQGVASPELLIKGSGSPHGYSLSPSEARILADAELLIWVGPQLESFLSKSLATLAREAKQLELMTALAPELLPARRHVEWGEHAHPSGDGHEDDGRNPHLWLSPLMAQKIVDVTLASLVELDPANAQQYQRNSESLKRRLADLHLALQAELRPLKDIPFVVFHDAYQYFEAAYDLNAVASITLNPERKPGVRRIMDIRDRIKEVDARCVFIEPQFEPRLAQTIIEGTGARIGVLDPLGSELKAGPEAYFQLMRNLAAGLVAGLQ